MSVFSALEEVSGKKFSYGPCRGGPYDGQSLAHYSTTFQVAIDNSLALVSRVASARLHPKTVIPGMVASVDPNIQFGTYRFADGTWTWHESAPSAPPNTVHNETR